MKKLYALAVMAIMLVSLAPAALAQNGSGSDSAGSAQIAAGGDDASGTEPIAAQETVQARERLRLMNASANGGGPLGSPRTEEGMQMREALAQRVQAARERYLTARERYSTAKEEYLQKRAQFAEAKEEFQNCRGDNSEECDQTRQNIRERSRDILVNTADRVSAMMEQVREKIGLSSMAEEEKAERIAAIDARMADIESARQEARAISNGSTTAQIRTAANEMKQSWARSRQELKVNAGRLLNSKIGGIAVQMEQLSAKLESIVSRLEGRGYDVSGIDSLVADFDAEIESAKSHQEEAESVLGRETEPGEVDEQMKEATEHMRLAKQDLADARAILRQIVQEIKATGNGESALEEESGEEAGNESADGEE